MFFFPANNVRTRSNQSPPYLSLDSQQRLLLIINEGLGGLRSRWFASFGAPWTAAMVKENLAGTALASLVGLLTSGQSLGTRGLAGFGSLWGNQQALVGQSLLDTAGMALGLRGLLAVICCSIWIGWKSGCHTALDLRA
ncbi:hypothetical protein MRX96_007149 [Rhipicephalus microplus]